MGLNLKSIMNGKKNANSGNVTQVKKSSQTTDSIISQAVSNAGNISSMTLSKEEHDRLLTARHKMPIHIVVLKYFSLAAMAGTIIAGLLLKADLAPRNDYLSFLGVNENTGSKFVKLSQENNVLKQENSNFETEITSITERSEAFDESSETRKISLLVPEILEVEKMQKIWFDKTIEELNEDGELVEVKKFGLIDSFGDMIDYFEDTAYQPRFFNEKRRKESLSSSDSNTSTSKLIMANEINIRGLSINPSGASVTVSASDLLSRVFTLSSEFVVMMNSFDFFKGANVSNFTRRELDEGGDTTEVALRLEFQKEEEEDPDDKYLIDLIEWQEQS